MALKGKKDKQKADTSGKEILHLIEDVIVRPAYVNMDERGTLTEMYNPSWGLHADPLVYVYKVTVRPGVIKGWVEHHKQWDRLFFSWGVFKIVLFDNRPKSPTYKLVNEIFLGESKPGLVIFPPFIYHAVQNIGEHEATFINMPTRAYDHADPDKYRLSLDTKHIGYKFNLVRND